MHHHDADLIHADAVRQNHPPPLVELDHLSVHFGPRSAIEEISATICAGEIVSLAGPNGAGKSTLLKVIAGILPPSHGEARLRGERISRPNPSVVYVPQCAGVDWSFPISVLDVALMGRLRRQARLRPSTGDAKRLALAALEQVGMAHLASVQIGTLSGGQQQRVFLARAILQGGDLLLLDEPFGGVDTPTQDLLLGLFDAFRRSGKTIVFATHDLIQARRISDRLMLINRRLIALGPPAEVLTATGLHTTFGGQAIVVSPPPFDRVQQAPVPDDSHGHPSR